VLLPGERQTKAIAKREHEKFLLTKIRNYSSRQVYGGLLFYARLWNWKDGWAGFAFKEIYGVWPLEKHKSEPLDCRGTPLEEWCALRKRKRKTGKARSK
jgi:hypothetical protein